MNKGISLVRSCTMKHHVPSLNLHVFIRTDSSQQFLSAVQNTLKHANVQAIREQGKKRVYKYSSLSNGPAQVAVVTSTGCLVWVS